MDFNELVENQISPILLQNGYEIIGKYRNIMQFESLKMEIRLVFDDREKSIYFYIGRRDKILYSLDNDIIRELLGYELLIDHVAIDVFIKNLVVLFKQNVMIRLLHGDISILESIVQRNSKEYTSRLLYEQTLKEASIAWEHKDYEGFVDCINKLENQQLPEIYLRKYNIAKKHI